MNLKGGTAKTVTTINAAAILARDFGARVLLIDADSQGNLTEFVTAGTKEEGKTRGGLSDLLRGEEFVGILQTAIQNVSILPADETLMALDISAAGNGAADPMALMNFLGDLDEDFDWCLIDCPPAFSAGAMAALIAADEVVIPMKIDAFGIRGMANLMEQIRNMKRVNRGLEVAGVLPTMVYPGPEQREAVAKLRGSLQGIGIRCFHPIRRSEKVDQMTFNQKPLIYSAPKGHVTHDYKLFVRDLVAGAKEGGEG